MNDFLEDEMEECILLFIQDRIPDGESGFKNIWAEGAKFEAAFDFRTSALEKIAAAQGAKGLYDVYLRRDMTLTFHNVFKRISDGQIFRVTSKDDAETPKGADDDFDLRLVSAEEWELA